MVPEYSRLLHGQNCGTEFLNYLSKVYTDSSIHECTNYNFKARQHLTWPCDIDIGTYLLSGLQRPLFVFNHKMNVMTEYAESHACVSKDFLI